MGSARHLPALEVKELPAPPTSYRRLIGPGVVAAGVGLASGEFVLWPYIASQAGLVLLWGAAVGIVTQWFLNMEIERYTLATGETALTGFSRLWKHWGLVFVDGYTRQPLPGGVTARPRCQVSDRRRGRAARIGWGDGGRALTSLP